MVRNPIGGKFLQLCYGSILIVCGARVIRSAFPGVPPADEPFPIAVVPDLKEPPDPDERETDQ